MNKLLIENINRIKQLMSLITEDVDPTCVDGDCENGKGTIKMDYVDGYMEFYEPFDRFIEGFMKNKIPNIDYYNSYKITFKNTDGVVLATAYCELTKELGMTGYGEITFSDGTTYKGKFTQEKIGDSISMECRIIIKDNMIQQWDPNKNSLKEEYKIIKDIYYTHFILPDIKKSEEEERKKTEEEITNKIKDKEEEILNIKKSEEEQKQEEIEKYKKQEEDINLLISKDARDVQDYIDNKNCSLLYDKITSMINSGTLATKEDFSDFEEECKGKLKIDQTTGEVSVETNSKYSEGLYKAITDACFDYDWDILDDLI